MAKKDFSQAPDVKKDPTVKKAVKEVFGGQMIAQEQRILELEKQLSEATTRAAKAEQKNEQLENKMKGMERERKTKALHVAVKPSFYDKIEAAVKDEGFKSVSALIETALIEHIEKANTPKNKITKNN